MIDVTIEMNSFGHLEITYKEDSLYIQVDTDIEAFLSDLTDRDREEVENGFPVECEIDSLYFGEH